MLKVNKEKCLGCGSCANICPEVFELDENLKAQIKQNADIKKNSKCIKEAIETCPVDAISK